MDSEAGKESVLPVLLDGDATTSLPVLLQKRVYADFRDEESYFPMLFDVLLTLYDIPPHDEMCGRLKDELHEEHKAG